MGKEGRNEDITLGVTMTWHTATPMRCQQMHFVDTHTLAAYNPSKNKFYTGITELRVEETNTPTQPKQTDRNRNKNESGIVLHFNFELSVVVSVNYSSVGIVTCVT